jgi:SAM-dependent methyltransferase
LYRKPPSRGQPDPTKEAPTVPDAGQGNEEHRFTGLADVYDRHRPAYPDAAIDALIRRARLGPASLLVDVGCGTGISSRLIAARGVPVVGVEPNADMRRRAEAEPAPPGAQAPRYQDGRAEATGLPDGVADCVLAAQAFHWFEPDPALREFHRVLKPGGWAALMWNERDESDPFAAAFGAVIRTLREQARIERDRARAGEPLLTHPCFEAGERLVFANEQALDEGGVLGRAYSMSGAPREGPAADALADALREVFARYQHGGRVVLRYETSLYLARRRETRAGGGGL